MLVVIEIFGRGDPPVCAFFCVTRTGERGMGVEELRLDWEDGGL